MKEIFGNLWDFDGILCITTNGTLRKDGACVMGRGVAYQATQRFPGIAQYLGSRVKHEGNHVHLLYSGKLISFPVKHNWWEKADLELIAQSVWELTALIGALEHPEQVVTVYLPRPGCGNGGLSWTEVKPLVEVLPDNIFLVGWPNEKGDGYEKDST